MPPKKTDMENAVEVLQRDVGRIAVLEQSIEEMKKQMGRLSVLERIEQRMIEEDEARKKKESEPLFSEAVSSQIGPSQTTAYPGGETGSASPLI